MCLTWGFVMRTVFACVLAAVAVAVLARTEPSQAGEDKPKYTIKQVMRMAHKSGLLDKVTEGDASKEEQKKLLELYTALPQNKPPAGDLGDWKKKTGRMVALAKAVVDGDKKAPEVLGETVNCTACHKAFKKK